MNYINLAGHPEYIRPVLLSEPATFSKKLVRKRQIPTLINENNLCINSQI